jgi:hypothetical protein
MRPAALRHADLRGKALPVEPGEQLDEMALSAADLQVVDEVLDADHRESGGVAV